jgi:hypothetical protein
MGRDAVSDAAANGDAQTSAKSAVSSTRTAARPRPDAAVSEFVFFIFLPRIIPIAIKIATPPPFFATQDPRKKPFSSRQSRSELFYAHTPSFSSALADNRSFRRLIREKSFFLRGLTLI